MAILYLYSPDLPTLNLGFLFSGLNLILLISICIGTILGMCMCVLVFLILGLMKRGLSVSVTHIVRGGFWDGDTEGLIDGEIERLRLALELTEGDADGEMLDTPSETPKKSVSKEITIPEGLTLGLKLAEGETEEDRLGDILAEGETLELGLTEELIEGLNEAEADVISSL